MGVAARIWQRYASRPWLSFGWVIVILHAAGTLRTDLGYPKIFLFSESYFLLLALVGLVRRWGPAVQFTLAGWCLTQYWGLFPGVSSDYMESVWQDLIDPAICAGIGLLLGAYLELVEWIKKTS